MQLKSRATIRRNYGSNNSASNALSRFQHTMQSNFQGMLENGMWQGLINSSLYGNNQFQFVCTPALAGQEQDSVTMLQALVL